MTLSLLWSRCSLVLSGLLAAPPPAVQGAADIITAIVNQLIQWYVAVTLLLPAGDYIVATSAMVTYQQPAVVQFWQMNVFAADGLLALILLWIAYNIILGVYGPLQVLPRVILAALAVHSSLQIAGLFIELNNALCRGALLTAVLPTTADLLLLLFGFIIGPALPLLLLFSNVFLIGLLVFMALVVALEMLVRVGLLDLLIVVAPLALVLYASPASQRWANLWVSAFFATVFVQFLQVTALTLGAKLVTGLGGFSIVTALAGTAILGLTLSIPRWLGQAVVSAMTDTRSAFR